MKRLWALACASLASIACMSAAHAQAKTEISITRQPGILYLVSDIMERQGLIEKDAAALGVPGLTTKWVTLGGGGAQTDTLLAGGVDIVNTGTGNLLLLWDRTHGHVKGIVANSAQPLLLVSRDPRIKTLADIGPGDRIAVPTVKVSTQAILLQMASAKLYGEAEANKLDADTVQLSHPDAMVALANSQHEIKNHFSAPPFQYLELNGGAHIVAKSQDIIGGPLSQAQFFTTTQFADANPVVIKAVRAATTDAIAFIKAHPRDALQIYKDISGDKASLDDLDAILKQPDMMDFRLEPQGTMKFAEHLHKTGVLKTMPKSWTDYYLPVAADLPGS